MAHQHVHIHTHNHALTSLNTVFIVCIVINLLFVIIEAGVGFLFNSLGLLSDAGHNLSDVFSLLLSLFAYRMAKRHTRTSIGRCGILDGWNRNSCQRHHGMAAYEEPKA